MLSNNHIAVVCRARASAIRNSPTLPGVRASSDSTLTAQQTSQDRIRNLVDNLVEKRTNEIRNSAMEAVAVAIGGMPTTITRGKPGPKAAKGATKTTRKRHRHGLEERSSISSEALLRTIEKGPGRTHSFDTYCQSATTSTPYGDLHGAWNRSRCLDAALPE